MQENQRKLLLVEDNPGDARLVQEMLAEAENCPFQIRTTDTLVGALNALAQDAFDVVLLDLSLPDSHGLETLLAVQRYAADIPVVLLTGLDNEAMALTAVERGAQDYLVKGHLTPEVLVRALQYAVARRRRAADGVAATAAKAKVIGVLGVKGGMGTTTCACHLAEELRAQSGESVLLMDLDPSASSAAFLMRPQSAQYTTLDASTNLHRLDAGYWRGIVSTTAGGVDLLQSPGAVRFADRLESERVRHVLRFARGIYQWVVIDLGKPDHLSLHLLEETSELFLVTTPELPALYEAGRWLRKLTEMGLHKDDIHLLLNRTTRAIHCAPGDLAHAMGHPIAASFPDTMQEFHEAYGEGRFLERGLPLRKGMAPVIARLIGHPPVAPKKSVLGFLHLARA